jgi:hypothetical protein
MASIEFDHVGVAVHDLRTMTMEKESSAADRTPASARAAA